MGTDGDDGGDVPTTLPSGQTPRPSRPGTKYPVRGIPHFDMVTYGSLFCLFYLLSPAVLIYFYIKLYMFESIIGFGDLEIDNYGYLLGLYFWEPGNTGKRISLTTWEPGNIGTRTSLTTWEPGNTGTRTSLTTWEPGNTGTRTSLIS